MDRLEAIRAQIRRSYIRDLPRRLERLRAAAARMAAGDEAAAVEIRELAHQIGGSAETFGFPALTTAAFACSRAPPDRLRPRSDALIEAVETALASAGDDAPP